MQNENVKKTNKKVKLKTQITITKLQKNEAINRKYKSKKLPKAETQSVKKKKNQKESEGKNPKA